MKLTPRAVIEAFSRAEYGRYMKAATAPPAGIMEAVRLLDQREFIFRGRAYRVPPVPWHLAAEILDVRERLRSAAPGARLADTVATFNRAARLSKKACRPTGLLYRALWILPFYNPFQKATPWQVGRNLGFFSTCLVLDQHQSQAEGPFRSGTSSPISPPSPDGTHSGRIRHGGQASGRATRSAGHTS